MNMERYCRPCLANCLRSLLKSIPWNIQATVTEVPLASRTWLNGYEIYWQPLFEKPNVVILGAIILNAGGVLSLMLTEFCLLTVVSQVKLMNWLSRIVLLVSPRHRLMTPHQDGRRNFMKFRCSRCHQIQLWNLLFLFKHWTPKWNVPIGIGISHGVHNTDEEKKRNLPFLL